MKKKIKRAFCIFLIQLTSINIYAQVFNEQKVLNLVEILSHDSLEGRKTGTLGSVKAQKVIQNYYKTYHLKRFTQDSSYLHPFKIGNKTGVNILGHISGSVAPDRYIIMSAHYDHLGIRDGEIYNGADDNASGVGGLAAAIEYFTANPPKNSILFAAFDAEEMDVLGSKNFINNPPVLLNSILLNINLDMVSRNDKRELYASGTSYYPHLKSYLQKSGEKHPDIKLKFGHDSDKIPSADDWTFSSDHGPFHQKNIPFIYFGVEDHEDYHKPSDDFKNLNKSFYLSGLKLIIDFVQTLDYQTTK